VEDIADMHVIFQHPFHSEILAELPEREVGSTQFTHPIGIMLPRVGVGGPLIPAVEPADTLGENDASSASGP
jgi:hypothetical protein